MLYYEDVELDKDVTFDAVYHVTEEEIIEVGERWDPQPFHIDPEAAKASIFGGLVASSAHVFVIWVSMGNDDIDKDKAIASVSALGFNNLQWHAPIRPGDAIRSSFRITEKRESKSRPELGVVTSDNRMFNQDGETVFTLECAFLVPKRPPA
ncbi:MAG: MaoC/PaaZ C-terminal domain-containing protein [Halioglobus sp.]